VTDKRDMAGNAASVLRRLCTWLLMCTLVLCSISLKAHAHAGFSGQAAMQTSDFLPSPDDPEGLVEASCHCAQHLNAVVTYAALLPAPMGVAPPASAVNVVGIPHPPSTPRKPPKA
jgi:hypothetical protein